MRQKLFYLLAITFISSFFSISVFSQDSRAMSFEVKKDEKNYVFYGQLIITVNGQQKVVAEEAADAWLISGGKEIVYTSRDGAGGFENEGQSLYIYDVQTGKSRKIMAQYYGIIGVSEHKLKKRANCTFSQNAGRRTRCFLFFGG
ncbi:MAG: hypothetical protein HC846_14190 [Blastocatellia bacterium]|nr:hypothetical protein [Blastocatellia bacterium]